MRTTRAFPQWHPSHLCARRLWALLGILTCISMLAAAPCMAEDAKSRLRGSNHFPKLSAAMECAADRTLGTAVTWERSVTKAGEKARREGKMVFVIHVSGDFENSEFT